MTTPTTPPLSQEIVPTAPTTPVQNDQAEMALQALIASVADRTRPFFSSERNEEEENKQLSSQNSTETEFSSPTNLIRTSSQGSKKGIDPPFR